jgi:ABC-type amino acid transport substrate-binding protein
MHTLAVALLTTCAMSGTLRFDRRRIVRYLAITAVLTVAVIGGARQLFTHSLHNQYSKDKVLGTMHLRRPGAAADVRKEGPRPELANDARPRLDGIRERGVLTVGYLQDSLPYAFFNAAGDLVGFDVDVAHQLAAELNVRLELVALDRGRFEAQVDAGECDIVMSGVVVTTLRASRTLFSTSYLDETMGFVVPDGRRDEFLHWEQLRANHALRLGIPNLPYYVQKVRERLPDVQLHTVNDLTPFFASPDRAGIDGLVFAAERGSAWTLMHPQFTVVIPESDIVKVPLAYPIGRRDQAFAAFVNTWIELKRKDGTFDSLYKYWILGQNAAVKTPRWSIMRNVLHWTR